MRTPLASLALGCAFALPALAQDMIAVGWGGTLHALDSYTGAVTSLGAGLFGQNAIARDGLGGLIATTRTQALPYVYDLTRIDPATLAVTPLLASSVDVRAFASTGNPVLYAVVNAPTGTADSFALVDTLTLTTTIVGPTGFGTIQALALKDGTLYAWDLNLGLLTIDPTTGAATDLFPTTGAGGANLQWLAVRGDGALVGGNQTLYSVDLTTGVAAVIAGGLPDLRGAEPWQSHVHAFGTGCAATSGTATLAGALTPGPGAGLTLQSTNHAPNAIGLTLIGFSNTTFGGLPLPLLLDPIFGTTNCSAYLSADISVAGITSAVAPATLSFQLTPPPLADVFTFFAQHLVLEAVPGGLSLSNAVVVQLGP